MLLLHGSISYVSWGKLFFAKLMDSEALNRGEIVCIFQMLKNNDFLALFGWGRGGRHAQAVVPLHPLYSNKSVLETDDAHPHAVSAFRL